MCERVRTFTIAGPGSPCWRCGRRHRDWFAIASCRWPSAEWIAGARVPRQGPCFALLAHCHALTITLWGSEQEAEASKRVIDKAACGGRCCRRHEIVRLDALQAAPAHN